MILELLGAAVIAGVAFLLGTKRGKADLAALKLALAPDLAAAKVAVLNLEAEAKAKVLAVLSKIEKL